MGLAHYADALSQYFTVYNYDRRGRGESTDTPPYAIERETEDIDALIEAAGGPVFLFGASSGAVLALDAVAHGSKVTKLAVYEPPFIVDDKSEPISPTMLQDLKALVAAGKPGDAAELFLTKGAMRLPAEAVAGMRAAPYWAAVEAAAPTLVYDATLMEGLMYGKPLPAERWASVTVPTLVLNGGASAGWAQSATDALASVLPGAERQTLEGQTHEFQPEAITPVLQKFFLG